MLTLLPGRYYNTPAMSFHISCKTTTRRAGPPLLTPTPSFSDYLVATGGSQVTYSFLMIVSSLLLLALLALVTRASFSLLPPGPSLAGIRPLGKRRQISGLFYCRSLICAALKVKVLNNYYYINNIIIEMLQLDILTQMIRIFLPPFHC